MKLSMNNEELVPDETWHKIQFEMRHHDGYLKAEFYLPENLLHWFHGYNYKYMHRFAANLEGALWDATEDYFDSLLTKKAWHDPRRDDGL